MTISYFIRHNPDRILAEWDEFARSLGAAADEMSREDLRDHARQILEFVAADIDTDESWEQARAKSHDTPAHGDGRSASSQHGRGRYDSGFTLLQLIAEYRALRASVLRLWQQDQSAQGGDPLETITRFNEAIDQSLTEAAVAYSDRVNETRDMFLAILGHDLRGPLAATSTAGAYLLRPGAFDEQVQQIGIRIKRSVSTALEN